MCPGYEERGEAKTQGREKAFLDHHLLPQRAGNMCGEKAKRGMTIKWVAGWEEELKN